MLLTLWWRKALAVISGTANTHTHTHTHFNTPFSVKESLSLHFFFFRLRSIGSWLFTQMGTRSSRLQVAPSPPSLSKRGGVKRESRRRRSGSRPTSLSLDLSGSFDRDSEANRSRSEEGSDSDTGSPTVLHGTPDQSPDTVLPKADEKPGEDDEEPDENTGSPDSSERLAPEEDAGPAPHRTFSERLPGGRHASVGRSSAARSARVRSSRPVSEAWIGLYRVRHGTIRCPFCTKPFPGGRIEEHLLSCLTSPPLPYNTDVLSKDIGECSICLEDLLQGETIARLACLCVYHKKCIDSWSTVKPCCPEHPFD
ncbi:E3 ubiquitin-protein ligase znrf2 isoform X1 [Astyanax mexicanus]|uniref:E3 ubiquitin-protein ligase znrf2 isoform X1 n=1 Tax=Astyanax mexicanus TaxID=7994 RepID=UPI0020CB21DE|nr:E3 ubiquitin-protein ligase znrf2 isoform X1 [Astyanax mexicanus]XP_049338946.1 E3 ubiquitin-protein ligase znrf2 isoform X1 [Astyanax mexicanus]